MDSLKKYAGILVGVALSLIAAVETSEKIWPSLKDDLSVFKILLVALFGLGALIYVFWAAATAWGSTEYNFTIRRMRRNEMDTAVLLSKKLLPGTLSRRELKRLYQTNNTICRLQSRRIRFLGLSIQKHTGLCSILPMTQEARQRFEEDDLTGLSLGPEHVVPKRQPYSCVYVGSIGALGFRAQKHISTFISGVIDSEFDRGLEVVFTRPTTRAGLTAAKRFGLSPVSDDAGPEELERLYRITDEEYREFNN